MYPYGTINYTRKKNADGSVSVTRTPEYDGVTFVVLLPVFLVLIGIAGTMYDAVTLNFDAIGGLWTFVLWGVLITLMAIPVVLIVDLVRSSFKK